MAMVINLFGAPGVGKSTGAAYIFSKLKMQGVNAELVTEFAKDKTWEENGEALKNQAYIFGKQSFRMSRCCNKVDFIVTDSPLPLSILYNNGTLPESFNKTVMDVFNTHNNLNYLLTRVKPYNPVGRNQTESESDLLGKSIQSLLDDRGISYKKVSGDEDGYTKIISELISLVSLNKILFL